MRASRLLTLASLVVASVSLTGAQQQRPTETAADKPAPAPANPKLEQYKKDVAADIDAMKSFTAEMNDMVFSFGELGFQEFETSKYLAGVLRKNGFTVQEGIAGVPTLWVASWG